MVIGFSPGRSRGIFITSGMVMSARLTRQKLAMPPGSSGSSRRKPSITSPRSRRPGPIWSVAPLQAVGERDRQAGIADLPRGLVDVVGDANVSELVSGLVEHRVAGGGIVIARLADRADHSEPAARLGEGNGAPVRLKAGQLAGHGRMKQ